MRRVRSLLLAVTLASVGVSAAPARANLIVNGDFSAPSVGAGWGLFASIPGWTSHNGDTIEVGNSAVYSLPCANATCSNLELNANTFGDVTQTVTGLTVGHTYTLSWLYGGRSGAGAQLMNVYFGDISLPANSATDAAGWTLNSYSFAATTPTAVLEFLAQNVGGQRALGNEVTNVFLAPAPGPAAGAWALLALFMRARSRRRA
jgi:hypothetical protein